MPPPKAKEEAKKGNKKQTTQYDENGHWVTFQKQDELRQLANPLFETYYRDTQAITGGDAKAFEEFVATLRTPLQTTVWINDCDPLAQQVSDYFAALPKDLASPIPWYPIKGMAWRLHTDKVNLRRDPTNNALRQFMIKQTAMGTISRQEEVSMIPPFLLDIQEKDQCLDMCASPGSKTAQMLCALGRLKRAAAVTSGSSFPFDYQSEGFVVANELDTSRANMLVHQVKRLRTLFPFALFANHDARYFPELGTAEAPVRFDKILCDVVCSGDGTIRKSPFIFKVWTPREAIKLQKTQILIALRACVLLKVGGRMVYSTCSLNPIENEAVVAQILARTGGAIKLVDGRSMLPGLECDPGLATWKVTNNKGEVIEGASKEFHEALFPLANPPADMDLSKCMRLMPKHCQGGGFFIAVFEKVAEFTPAKRTAAAAVTADDIDAQLACDEAPPKRPPRKEKVKEGEAPVDPKVLAEEEAKKEALRIPPQFVTPAPSQAKSLTDFYGLTDFPTNNLVVRAPTGERVLREDPTSRVYLVSDGVRRVLASKSDKVRIVSAGLRALDFEMLTGGFRIAYEASPLLTTFFERNPQRYVKVSRDFVCELIVGGKLKEMTLTDAPLAFRQQLLDMSPGAFFMTVPMCEGSAELVTLVGLRARSRAQLLVDHEDLVELKFRMGITEEELAAAAVIYAEREAANKAKLAAEEEAKAKEGDNAN